MHNIAQKALDSGLGARYIRGQIQSRLDDLMFLDPYAHRYTLQKDPETEKEKGCDIQP